jgi:hypothetical protein
MALLDVESSWPTTDPVAEIDAVDRRLEAFRAAIDEARRNGWRDADRLGTDLEEYLAAVRMPQREAWRRTHGAANPWSA